MVGHPVHMLHTHDTHGLRRHPSLQVVSLAKVEIAALQAKVECEVQHPNRCHDAVTHGIPYGTLQDHSIPLQPVCVLLLGQCGGVAGGQEGSGGGRGV